MKAILEFNLPDDKYDFEVHQKANRMLGALSEITESLRSRNKYGDDELSQEQCDKLYRWVLSVLDDHDIGPLVRG